MAQYCIGNTSFEADDLVAAIDYVKVNGLTGKMVRVKDFILPVTPAQEKYINDLMTTIKSTMRLELDWANAQTKKEAMEVIDLLKTTKSFVNLLKIKKDKLTPEQVDTIRAKINAKPTKAWLVASLKKLSPL